VLSIGLYTREQSSTLYTVVTTGRAAEVYRNSSTVQASGGNSGRT
jgi:hypothetical protein